jgi:hypothetical protein
MSNMSNSTIKNADEMPVNPPAAEQLPPEVQQFAKLLRIAGWTSFWLQLLIGVIAIVMLLFVVFSRNLSDDSGNIQTGFSIILNAVGIAILLFGVFTAFRYTRFGKRLMTALPHQRVPKQDVMQTLRMGAIASLSGMALTILSAAVGTGVLLAKLMAQPQGAAIYDPTEIVRVIDVLLIMSAVATIAAHYINSVTSLWLSNRMS